MAKITNIKTRDETVHPIALPFAICSNTAGATIKTLAFSGGDTPTELVNGQQIMVQFTNGNTTACSISIPGLTSTPAMTLNNTSVTPYIGAGAVVNLTYNGSKFYVSNAAALTGFEVPTGVTLATITNAGGTVDLIDIKSGSTISDIQNIGTINQITNQSLHGDGGHIASFTNTFAGSIDEINNSGSIDTFTSSGTIGEVSTSGTMTDLSNSGTIGAANSIINGIQNTSTGTIYHISNSGQIGQDGTTYGFINQSSGTISYEKNCGLLKTLTNGVGATITYLYNHSTITTLNNEVSETYNYAGEIGTLNNQYKITTLNNSGAITQFINNVAETSIIASSIDTFENHSSIRKIDNVSGKIGTSGATLDGIFNRQSANIYYIENSGKIFTFKNTGTTGNSGSTTTGVQNTGYLYNVTNGSGGTIYKLINTANIKTITNSKTITQIKNAEGGSIGEITNSGTITNIYNNSDSSGRGTISLFQNSNQVDKIENWGQVTTIINIGTHTISELQNNGNIKTFTVSSTGSIGVSNDSTKKLENNGQIYRIDNNKLIGYKNTSGTVVTDYGLYNNTSGTIYYISNEGYIPFITNKPSGSIYQLENKTNAKLSTIYNHPSGIIRQITNNGEISTISNVGAINSLSNPGTITALYNEGHLKIINNSANLELVFPTGNYEVTGRLPYSDNGDFGTTIQRTRWADDNEFWQIDPFITIDNGHEVNWSTSSFVVRVSNIAAVTGTRTIQMPVIYNARFGSEHIQTLRPVTVTSNIIPEGATTADFSLNSALPDTPQEYSERVSRTVLLITNPQYSKQTLSVSRDLTFLVDGETIDTYTLVPSNTDGYTKNILAFRLVGYMDDPTYEYQQKKLYLAPLTFTV